MLTGAVRPNVVPFSPVGTDLTGGDYILSVYTNHPISIKIKKRANGGYRAGWSALFGTCIELIQHHIDHGYGASVIILGWL